MTSLTVAIVGAALLVAACLVVATKLRGGRVRYFDALVIATLCSVIAPLPIAGWILATIVFCLLVTRVMDMELWPDTVAVVVAANVVWIFVLGTL